MSSRIAVFGFDVDWQRKGVLDAASNLNDQIVFWNGCSKEDEEYYIEQFPEFIPEETVDVNAFLNDREFTLLQVDEELAPYLGKLWVSYLKKRRSSPLRFSGLDIRVDFYRQIAVGYSIIKKARPDVVIYSNVPTGFLAYCVYIISKHMGIHTYILKRVLFPDRYNLSYLVEELEAQSRTVLLSYEYAKQKFHDINPVVLPTWLEVHLRTLREGHNVETAVPDYFVLKDKINRETREIESYRINWFKAIKNTVFKVRKGMSLFGGCDNIYQAIRRRRLVDSYEEQCTEIDYQKKYVYVPLHMQPEASTMPNGGMFAYQVLMIDILSKALPAGWKLYVREHPAQLYFYYPDSLHRTKEFYEQITGYDNVQLVSERVSSLKLAENSEIVATVTGYSGWEAVNRRKPVMVFGAPWYEGCDGVFSVRNLCDAINFFDQVLNGYQPDLKKVDLFVSILLENVIHGEYRTRFQEDVDNVAHTALGLSCCLEEAFSVVGSQQKVN